MASLVARPRLNAASAAAKPLSALLVGIIIPVAISPFHHWTVEVGLLGAVTIYSGLTIGWLIFAETPSLARYFGLVFTYLFLGLAPLEQIYRHSFPLSSPVNPSAELTASIIVFVFFAFAESSYLIDRSRSANKPAASPRTEFAVARLPWLVVLSVTVFTYELIRIGGPGVLLSNRNALNVAVSGSSDSVVNTSTQAIGGALLTTPILIAAYLFLAALRTGRIARRYLIAAFLTVLAIFARNPVVSARYAFGVAVIALVCAATWPLRTAVYRYTAAVSLLGLTVFFAAFNSFRFATSGQTSGTAFSNPANSLTRGDYDAFQQLINTIEYVRTFGHTNGKQTLSSLLFFVPHSLYPGRGIDSGVLVAQNTGYQFTNLSCPLPAEAYLDFSWFGVAVFGIAIGFGWSRLDRAIVSTSFQMSFLALAAPILAVSQVLVLRGSLLQSVGPTIFAMLLIFLCARRRQGQAGKLQGRDVGCDHTDENEAVFTRTRVDPKRRRRAL